MAAGRGWAGRSQDEPGLEGEAGEVGAAAAAGLVPGPVQVAADGADGDEQFPGDHS
jgi:hypothetical protein